MTEPGMFELSRSDSMSKKPFIDLEEETGADFFWSNDLEDSEDDYHELSEESEDDE